MPQLNTSFSYPGLAAAVHVGTPPPDFDDWKTTKVYFHNFANLPVTAADDVPSTKFSCLGRQWRLRLGFAEADAYGRGKLRLYISLHNMSHEVITVKCGISIKDNNNQILYSFVEAPWQYSKLRWEFITRQQAMNCLMCGTLVVEVSMKRPRDPWQPFIPPNPSVCDIVKDLFMDEESADVIFEVGGKQEVAVVDAGLESNEDNSTHRSTDAATEPKTFFAHTLILKKAAPLLAEMCASDDNDGTPPTVQIPNVQPETFHGLLRYIYGRTIPDLGADISHTKELIEAADRYGLSNLKLKAEACYVSSLTVTMENVMEHLHFADSKNCALLKENVMDFIVENKGDILENSIMTDAPIDLVNDVLAAMFRAEKKGQRNYVNDSYSVISISELREKAYYEQVDIDGSRESLIASLKQAQAAIEDEDGEDEDEEGEEVGGEEAEVAEVEE